MDKLNELTIREFFENKQGKSLTYDDFIILPGYAEGFTPRKVILETNFSTNIKLKLPLVASPMDTVTGELMARWMALLGGIGIIHYNCPISEQVQMVKEVKRFENGFILDPAVASPNDLISKVTDFKYKTIPITEDGSTHGKLVGMLRNLDFDPEIHQNLKISARMITVNQGLVVAKKSEVSTDDRLDILKANEIIREKRLMALPIIDEAGNLFALSTRTDIDKNRDFPLASKDKNKSLRVGAAVGTQEEDKIRAESLVKAGVDVLVVDSGHGHASYIGAMVKHLKQAHPQVDVAAGNVATADAINFLADCGADAIKVGVGSGSICTTQEVTGVGRGQVSAVYDCVVAAKKLARPIPIIADGGIRKSGDIVKALLLGAGTVMLGNYLAGTYEALGDWIELERGVKVKEYRGMGSKKAMQMGSAVRYQVTNTRIRASEGVVAHVIGKGHVYDLIPETAAALKQGIYKVGYQNIYQMQQAAEKGEVKIEERSTSARTEGNIHDLYDVTSS